jgi:glutaconate CoA-transferase subunit B
MTAATRNEATTNGATRNEATRNEVMACATARRINNSDVVLVGTGLPMVAVYLAKRLYAPQLVMVFESGIVDANPTRLATGVGDMRLVRGAALHLGMRGALGMLQSGKVTLGLLGAAEIDRYGNINSTVIGDYRKPTVRLPGSGGANDIASMAERVLIIAKHSKRRFPERLAYTTTPGFLGGRSERESSPLPGGGPAALITDLGVFGFDMTSGQMTVESLHSGVSADEVASATGFPLEIPSDVPETAPPTAEELDVLRTRIDPTGIYIGDDKA